MKNISILGATGSIGVQTLNVIRENRELFNVCAITANDNLDIFEKQIREFEPKLAVLANEKKYMELKQRVGNITEIVVGVDGLNQAATMNEADIVVSAIVGIAGLIPTYNAITKRKKIALANKETLVTAGKIIMEATKKYNVDILPVDSEHSAIFQSIGNNNMKSVSKLILTASGGPFRNHSVDELMNVTLEETLNHPNWNMGKKITVDCATLMNKGLEVIEARWLFDTQPDKIEVCVHPQSIIHSMVEFIDGSVIAQLGIPDMQLPIQYALTYPDRVLMQNNKLDLFKIGELNFYKADTTKFPCLKLAYNALKAGESACIVLNGANEIAVSLFLQKKISFNDIPILVTEALEHHEICNIKNIDDVIQIDNWARSKTIEIFEKRCS